LSSNFYSVHPIWKQKNLVWKVNIKFSSVAANFVIFGAIENVPQYPHLLPIGVKFGVMTLQVIPSSMSNFGEN
jgi:hypothetical protein